MSPHRSNFLNEAMNQVAVYWGNPQSDGSGGRSFGESPVEIDCRWEQRSELYVDSSGQEKRSQAGVYVNQDLDCGGYLYLGELDDLSVAEQSDPLIVAEAYEIRGFEKTPSFRADIVIRKALL